MEHRYRSFVKAVSWQVTGTIDTFIVSYFITHKVALALSIGGVEIFTKMFLYYFHERTWDRLKFGRKEIAADYEI